MERRKTPRFLCRYPCEISSSQGSSDGVVLDVSEAGLSIQTQCKVYPEGSLCIRIKLPGNTVMEVEARVWHSRRARKRGTDETYWMLGLILLKTPDAYIDLLPIEDAKDEDEAKEEESDAADQEPAQLRPYRIRVKHRSGPRTRVLSLSAKSEDEARSLATADLMDDWELLEVFAVV